MTAGDGDDGLRVEQVRDRRALVRFLEMPKAIYADDPNWVPPLLFERLHHLDPRKNPYFDHAEAAYWIACRHGRPVGRISAQADQAHIELHDAATGHFGFLEAEDDPDVFQILLTTAENWLRERKLTRVLGPFTLSINDESGLLVEGFETPPYLMMGHGRPYYARRLEQQGYTKAKDLIAYAYDLSTEPPATIRAFIDKAKAENDLRFRPMDKRRFGAELSMIVDIFNDAWAGNWEFLPFSEPEMRYLADNLKPLLRADDVAIAEIGGEPVAMAVSLPNVNEAIADLGGRLLPFGWAKLVWRLKVRGTKSARMPLMGVRRQYQGTPLTAALMLGVIDLIRVSHRARGTERSELSWILEDNRPTRRLIEKFGGRAYKTYRIYEKNLK
jgi:hypothetical protein